MKKNMLLSLLMLGCITISIKTYSMEVSPALNAQACQSDSSSFLLLLSNINLFSSFFTALAFDTIAENLRTQMLTLPAEQQQNLEAQRNRFLDYKRIAHQWGYLGCAGLGALLFERLLCYSFV